MKCSLTLPAQQSRQISEESVVFQRQCEETVKMMASGRIRIALHNGRSRVMNVSANREHAVSIECTRSFRRKHGKDVQEQDEEGDWEEDCH